jgi:hypothetical protein
LIKRSVTLEEVLAFLNELTVIDPHAMYALISARVPCNQVLGDHPTVQASGRDGKCEVGFLGVLNGLFGTYEEDPLKGWGAIMWDGRDDGLPQFGLSRETLGKGSTFEGPALSNDEHDIIDPAAT